MKRWFPIVAMTTLVFAAAFIGCAEQEGEESAENHDERSAAPDRVQLGPQALAGLHLEFATAEEQELSPSLEVPAELMPNPDRRATVGPRVAGRVIQVRVNIGDRIQYGTPLVVLESHEVGSARADVTAAEAQVDVIGRAAERERGLLEDRVTSQRKVEEAEGALQIAEAELQAARTRLVTFGASSSACSDTHPAQVVLTSPIAGTVVARAVHVGQWVELAETLIEVVDLDELWLQAAVYEREMRYVSVGQPVQVEVRAYPGEVFTGRVDQIGGTLDERTRTVTVRVVLPNPDHHLKPGMFATARIHGTHAYEPRRLLTIPWAAVQEVDDHRAVFLRLDEGLFELRRVHTGERAGDLVEILNGLTPGDEVVTDGSFLLKGQLLRSTLGEEE